MNFAFNCIPVVAVALAQYDASAPSFTGYGALGVICAWLVWRDERQMKQTAQIHEGMRDDNSKLREEFRGFVHQMKGLNRNLIYYVATHATGALREVAEREMERLNQQIEKPT